MLEYYALGATVIAASGLIASYKHQRAKDKRKLSYILRANILLPPVSKTCKNKPLNLINLITKIHGLGSARALLKTSRGRAVILSLIQDEYGWVAYRLSKEAIDWLLPKQRDRPWDIIKAIFKPDI